MMRYTTVRYGMIKFGMGRYGMVVPYGLKLCGKHRIVVLHGTYGGAARY